MVQDAFCDGDRNSMNLKIGKRITLGKETQL
jgi:hypothetical protein